MPPGPISRARSRSATRRRRDAARALAARRSIGVARSRRAARSCRGATLLPLDVVEVPRRAPRRTDDRRHAAGARARRAHAHRRDAADELADRVRRRLRDRLRACAPTRRRARAATPRARADVARRADLRARSREVARERRVLRRARRRRVGVARSVGTREQSHAQAKAFLHGTVATTVALVTAGALGWAAFVGRNWASDRALFLRALRIGTPDSLEDISFADVASRRRRGSSRSPGRSTSRARQARAQRASVQPSRLRALPVLGVGAHAGRGSRATWLGRACLAACGHGPRRRTAGDAHRGEARRARTSHRRSRSFPCASMRGSARDRRTRPTWIMRHARANRLGLRTHLLRDVSREPGAFAVRPSSARTSVRRAPGRIGDRREMADVLPRGRGQARAGVRAHVRVRRHAARRSRHRRRDVSSHDGAPPIPPTSVRPRSLFVVATDGAERDGGTLEANVVPLLTARAFDRLYDELYGLFFRGDPRVPLRADEDE